MLPDTALAALRDVNTMEKFHLECLRRAVWGAVFGSQDPPISAPQNTLDRYIFGGAYIPLEIHCTGTVR